MAKPIPGKSSLLLHSCLFIIFTLIVITEPGAKFLKKVEKATEWKEEGTLESCFVREVPSLTVNWILGRMEKLQLQESLTVSPKLHLLLTAIRCILS